MLIAVIFFCLRLNKSIKDLHESGTDLEPILRNFSVVISQITQATEKLKSTSRDANVDFIQHIPKASALKDDLSFLLQHADQLIKRMEAGIESSKKIQRELEFISQKTRMIEAERQQSIPVKREEIITKTQVQPEAQRRTPQPQPRPNNDAYSTQKVQIVDKGLLSTLNTLR